MPWENRKNGKRYYTRSKRVDGRIVREYIGTGLIAELAHQLDVEERRQRNRRQRAAAARRKREQEIDNQADEFVKLTNEVARGMLTVAGCHQHNRGKWRKRRG